MSAPDMSATKAICRVLPICIDSGECPQAPSNRPLQPIKRHGNIKLGQPRKLCLAGGPIPRVIEHRPPRSTFSRSVFSTPSIFEEGRNFAFWGDLRGLCGLARPHARARLSRETGPFLAFPLFRQRSVASRRPERHHKATANARRSPVRFICHAERRRAVAVSQNSTDCVEARSEAACRLTWMFAFLCFPLDFPLNPLYFSSWRLQ